MRDLGSTPAPMNAYLLNLGLETLAPVSYTHLMAVCFFWRMLAGDFPRVLAAVSILFYSLGFIRAMLILQKIQKEERGQN